MTAQNVKNFFGRGVTSLFGDGRAGGRKHRGTDWSHSTTPGTPVPSLLDGVVVGKLSPASWHGFGYQVTIRSTLGGVTVDFSYAHGNAASRFAVGQKVKQGDIVMWEGRTGWTTGSCVHVELFRGGKYVDPLPYVRSILANGTTGGGSAGGGIPFNSGVLWVQQSLNRLGYTPRLVEDGKRGSATIAQTKRYQKAKGMKPDGLTGRTFSNALRADIAKLDATPDGLQWLKGWNWSGIQEMLKADFGYTGKIDNDPGKGTWEAMQRFLRKYGYKGKIDGLPGGGTIAALAAWLRARYGYVGNNVPGAVMKAAFARAAVANAKAYPKR
ncbi:lysin A [Microbacterium phage ValentiniPuff]|uniref:Lysin A n=1 Tax=Microbacterium phage ValentiniPuff TaxID=2315705 RepID=A0A386KQ61_9CAUD|nr:lysin A [Microbacterium phage ValentiniPuff]